MLAEWLTAPVRVRFAGGSWPLVFTHRVLLECEALTGVDMLAATLANPTAALVRALLYRALVRAGAECTLADVGAGIGPRSIPGLRRAVRAAWAASMAEPEPARRAEKTPGKPRTWTTFWAEAVSRDGLGLTEDQWLDMTPRMARELQKRRLEQMQREELMMGVLASSIAAFSGHCKKAPTAESFMFHPFEDWNDLPEGVVTGEHIMAQMAKGRVR